MVVDIALGAGSPNLVNRLCTIEFDRSAIGENHAPIGQQQARLSRTNIGAVGPNEFGTGGYEYGTLIDAVEYRGGRKRGYRARKIAVDSLTGNNWNPRALENHPWRGRRFGIGGFGYLLGGSFL